MDKTNTNALVQCSLFRFFGLMIVSSRCWSPFHTNECVFSRHEQQKVKYLFDISLEK